MSFGRLGFAILVLIAGHAAFGDGPASRPVGPKDVAREFIGAVESGRADDVAGFCFAADAGSGTVVVDMTALARAMARIRDAAARKYGPDAVDVVRPMMASSGDEMVETITGDHATVETRDGLMHTPLVKLDGVWKIDVKGLIESGEIAADEHGYLTALVRAIDKTAGDIAAGRLDSAESARDVLQARQAGIQDSPTTRPAATKPAN